MSDHEEIGQVGPNSETSSNVDKSESLSYNNFEQISNNKVDNNNNNDDDELLPEKKKIIMKLSSHKRKKDTSNDDRNSSKSSAFSFKNRSTADRNSHLHRTEPLPERSYREESHHRDRDDSYDKRKFSYENYDEPRKLKRPNRRKNKEEQEKIAKEIRERKEEQEKKALQEALDQRESGSVVSRQSAIDSVVRKHYNTRTVLSRNERRTNSPIIKLRNFNNAIKYMLIGKFTEPECKVLDIGCGKGGDLNKWRMARCAFYVGVDISDMSIKEAIHRYKSLRNTSFESIFATGDAYGTPIQEILSQFEVPWPMDVVSMQFCMHYAFETEDKVRRMLSNVSSSLKKGGYFVGTIPSSDFLLSKIAKLEEGEKGWKNSIYSVTFANDPPRDGAFRPPFGHMYYYYLKDAVDNVPEYVVPFEAFRALAEEFNLELRYKKTFHELFAEEIPTWSRKLPDRLIQGIKRTDGSLGVEGEESEATAFYLAFAFEKVGYE